MPHVAQALHNEEFHACINEHYNDRFFDWKITVLYYCAYHYLMALAEHRRINIGDRHSDIERNVNPRFADRGAAMPITRTAWGNYNSLWMFSWTARYNGIEGNITVFEELKKRDYDTAVRCLNAFKAYVRDQGVMM